MNKKNEATKPIGAMAFSLVALCMITGFTGCTLPSKDSNTKTQVEDLAPNEVSSDKETAKDDSTTDLEDESPVEETAEEEDLAVSFDMLSEYSFSFSSGAGGWSDDFNIEKDGYFHGAYHDSDMGDLDEELYPNGTVYFCNYEGHFADIEKIDEYTYKMKMTDITILNDDEEYIEDGTRWIPLTPYALDGADEIDIYLPGKPVSEMSEDVQMWLFIPYQEQQETLEDLALVNVNNEYGITSSERLSASEDAQMTYDSTKESFEYYNGLIEETSNTGDLISYTDIQKQMTDSTLNYIWDLIKYNTDDDTYNKILEEQRQWLKDRDTQLAGYTKEEYGTSYEYLVNSDYASMTLDRCEALLEYLK